MEAVLADDPPLRLLLGSDAVTRARTKIRQLLAEMDRWQAVSLGTDFGAEATPVMKAQDNDQQKHAGMILHRQETK